MLKPNKIELVMELTTLVSTIPGDTNDVDASFCRYSLVKHAAKFYLSKI
jgi:hypothetical protein